MLLQIQASTGKLCKKIFNHSILKLTSLYLYSVCPRAPNQVIGEGIEKARADGVSQQYHSQDEVGNYAYGYVNENSEKHEASDARSGMVKGHYVYVDGHGLNRRVDYVADNQGFHQKSIRPLVL